MIKVERIRDYVLFSSKWEICLTHALTRFHSYHRRRDRKIVRDGSGGCVQWSIIAWIWHGQFHNNSQRLWLHSQDLQNIKSAKIPAWTCEIPCLAERVLTSHGFWKWQNQFSQGYGLQKLPMLQWVVNTHAHTSK